MARPRVAERRAAREALGREGEPNSSKRISRLARQMESDSPKGYQAVKDAASSGPTMKARNMAKAQSAAEGFVERQRSFGRIGTVAESAGRKVSSIAKGVSRGLLSPAGLAEGVAGNVARLSDKAGKDALRATMSKAGAKGSAGSTPSKKKA